MKNSQFNADLHFLSGGGEMGEITRAIDWSQTAVGEPEKWPQSFRTTIGIVLNSKFPMFLWWGKELTCFYNDAYRPSLGINGKHPSILGMPAKDAWHDIWHIIEPLISQVMSGGESVWSEDQLIPIYRNGRMEDVYWTFSYSAVHDESGSIGGVLVTCSETTPKVQSLREIGESEERFRNLAESTDILISVSDETGHATYFNKAWVSLTGRKVADLLEFGWADLLHDQDREQYVNVYLSAFAKKSVFTGKFRVMNNDGNYHWLLSTGTPRFQVDGCFLGYINSYTDITKAEEATILLEESGKKLLLIIEATDLGTWELNLQTKVGQYSDRYIEIFDYPIGTQLTHDQLLKRLHPDDVYLLENAIKESYNTGVMNFQGRLIWEDASIHWMESKGKLFYDENQQPEKLIGTIRDITTEKNHEQELVRRELKFRLLADSMPQHIWTADTAGQLNYFNLSVYNYSGFTPEEMERKGWVDMVHNDDREENIRVWKQAIKTGSDFIFEHRFRRHDGTYRWQLSRAIPQRDADGNIQMWVGSSTDIEYQKTFTTELERQVKERTKELKELNESLTKSEERYHLMVEEVQDYAILYLNRDGTVENWNKGAEKIKGYKANEIIGQNFSNFYTQSDRNDKLPDRLLKQAVQTGKANQEGWRLRMDGTPFWANVTITAVHNESGEVIGFSKVTHDLSERKEINEQLTANAAQLVQKNAELQKMNKELESFAYISSHDLQEPLRKIQTFASRIQEQEFDSLSDNAKDNFQRMQNAAKRMQVLIEDLLVYSRTSDAQRKYVKSDLGKLIDEVKEDLAEDLSKKNAIVGTCDMIKAEVIPFQFRQLIQNLVSNSLKFSKENVTPRIDIRCETDQGSHFNSKLEPNREYCHLIVKDNGIGFDPAYSEKIFEVFQRLHGKTEYIGTGIGLAIVKKIVENLHGMITATGEVNKGATFDIYFPVKAKK